VPSLYVHIPFCERKCVYCDFYSIENVSRIDQFISALLHEINMYAHPGGEVEFETIFFGGGTPSLLTPEQLQSVLEQLHRTFRIRHDAEVTVETNPGTVTKERLAEYRTLGVNRLSIGVQSFFEDELHFLSRIHDRAQAIQCVKWARKVGFDNISLDLIYALPGQSLERWEQNLQTGLSLGPNHLSAYGLIVEDGTPLARMVQARQVSPAPTEDEANMYEFTMECMEVHGYEHYEVSNYAKPGFRSKHNYNYWRHENYLGFGPSAHSFWHSDGSAKRWWNIANLSHYSERLSQNELPLVSHEVLAADQLATERLFLGLRSDGFDIGRFRRDFGVGIGTRQQAIIDQLVVDQLATLNNESLRLTHKGYLLCDEICERLMPQAP